MASFFIVSKRILLWFVLCVIAVSCNKIKKKGKHPIEITKSRLQVSANGRYIVIDGKSPFFYLGDTGWELFHKLDREEAEVYLNDRASRGYNVIQAVAIAELEGLTKPNAYGDIPLIDTYSATPDTTYGNAPNDSAQYDYWDHVEYIVAKAKEKQLFVALLPCWGEYVTPRFLPSPVFANSEDGYNYGWFIANRLRKYDNIIWILGGDRLPDEHLHGLSTWRAMAEGIADATNGLKEPNGKADYSSTFMSYHCFYPSSMWFSKDEWIDMHMWGSYHEKRNNDRAFEISQYLWQHQNNKPNINSEPAYELGAINYDSEGKYGYFDDFDVLQQAYWSVFAGCAGHAYGASSIWQMYNANKYDIPKSNKPSWKELLSLPGAGQLVYLKKLIESKNMQTRMPAQEILVQNTHDPVGHLQATRGEDYAFVFVPTGKPIKINLGILKGDLLKASWFNPKNGEYTYIYELKNSGIHEFDPPGNEARGNAWVLVLETK